MSDQYASAGVNVVEADKGISKLVDRIKQTWPKGGLGAVQLPIGYFANVLDFDGVGLALCTDGVGSKTTMCKLLDRYDTIGIDCVAMNVNDLICVGAQPVSMLDYIGVEKADEKMLDQIGIGLTEGARQARISISGGEVAQLPGIIHDFDLVGSAVGRVALDRIITGAEVAPGDVVIGIASNGLHSNGFTLARKALFAESFIEPKDYFDELGMTIGAELLRPTAIYVDEVLKILDTVPVKALVNITGDGLLNLLRVNRTDAGFVLDNLPEPPPIFKIIQTEGGLNIDIATMYQVFNMGVGFCVVVALEHADTVMTILSSYGRKSSRIGYVVRVPENTLYLPVQGLVGKGKKFHHGSSGSS